MISIRSKRKWAELKNKLKIKYPELTDQDLLQNEGFEENMLRIVEYKLRKTKDEMQLIIADLSPELALNLERTKK